MVPENDALNRLRGKLEHLLLLVFLVLPVVLLVRRCSLQSCGKMKRLVIDVATALSPLPIFLLVAISQGARHWFLCLVFPVIIYSGIFLAGVVFFVKDLRG